MNNYKNTEDYYNYMNNQYNDPTYNQNVKKTIKMFDPYNGLIRGNMFQDLFNSYKLNSPKEIKPMNEQAELLTYVDSLSFAVMDLNLYLDVYPNDKEALDMFLEYRTHLNNYTKEYESKFGPLKLSSSALMKYPWAWDKSPWPWENK